MGELQLSPVGRLLAAIMSVPNVMTDVWRKRGARNFSCNLVLTRRDHDHDVALLPRAADFCALDAHSLPRLHAGFPIPTLYLLLGQKPHATRLLGVLLIVIGSLAMHRTLFAGPNP